jgi:hypothetical protein
MSGGVSARVVDLYVTVLGPFLQMYNGTSAFNALGSVPLNTPFKAAGAYKTANYGVVLNGGAVVANTDALVNTANALQIGRFSSSSNYLNGHIRSIDYYNTRLPNAMLQSLTAPAAFVVLDADGNSFLPSLAVLDSDGNGFTVSTAVLDSDGNSFSVTTA